MKDFSSLGKRIKFALEKSGKKQADLSKYTGIKSATVSQWCSDQVKALKYDNALKVAKFLGVNHRWLVTGKGPIEPDDVEVINDEAPLNTDEYITIKEYNITFACGDGREPTYDELNDSISVIYKISWFQERQINPANCKRFRIEGSSMEPLLFDGDRVLVDLNDTEVRNGRVYALIQDRQLKVKRLYKLIDGSLIVHSDNSTSNPDVKIPKNESNLFFKIIGRVIDKSGDGGL